MLVECKLRIIVKQVGVYQDRFEFEFISDHGKVTGRVSAAVTGRVDTRTKEEKLEAGKLKIKRLIEALQTAEI